MSDRNVHDRRAEAYVALTCAILDSDNVADLSQKILTLLANFVGAEAGVLYVLEGKAVYRLNRDWVEVEAGDFMWLRAFCPQACYAGPSRFRYLLYKDVNRHMKLGL